MGECMGKRYQMLAARVPRQKAEAVRSLLQRRGVADNRYKITPHGEFVDIPLEAPLKEPGVRVVRGQYPLRRPADPLERLKELLPERPIPRHWQRIGNVIVLKLLPASDDEKALGKAYAHVLGAKTVLAYDGVRGVCREPRVRLIYGDETETVHVENGIKYKMDVARIMWCGGNKHERMRMAHVSNPAETVVDMFAGIGYFTLPMAVYSQPQIYAFELNPVAHHYLQENIRTNHVEDRVVVELGDCRNAPEGIADRVVMGYLDSIPFLEKGMRVLKDLGGVIHFHQVVPNERVGDIETNIRCLARDRGFNSAINHRRVKSYAPCITHWVFDIALS